MIPLIEKLDELEKRDIGFLRQWLNEDRITENSRMVTNESIESWLTFLPELRRLALAGLELAEGVERMDGEMTAEGMPTLHSMRVMRAERDAALAKYREKVKVV